MNNERGMIPIMIAGGLLICGALALLVYEFLYLSVWEFNSRAGW